MFLGIFIMPRIVIKLFHILRKTYSVTIKQTILVTKYF